MTAQRLPVLFVSHGGGPWSYIDAMKDQYAVTAREFKRIPESLPERPRAVLVVTGH